MKHVDAGSIRLDADHVRGRVSGCGELYLARQPESRDLRVSGAANVRIG